LTLHKRLEELEGVVVPSQIDEGKLGNGHDGLTARGSGIVIQEGGRRLNDIIDFVDYLDFRKAAASNRRSSFTLDAFQLGKDMVTLLSAAPRTTCFEIPCRLRKMLVT
jgi:hypothetical protein